MWNKVKYVRGLAWALSIASCVLLCGCWITRSWKDYIPITGVALLQETKNYSGTFVPRLTGKHALFFRVIDGNWEEGTPINLRFSGVVKLWHDGKMEEYPFDHFLKTTFIPDCPQPFYLTNGIYMKEAEDSENDYGQFFITVEGDLDAFLSRNPKCDFIVRFIESK